MGTQLIYSFINEEYEGKRVHVLEMGSSRKGRVKEGENG
jgi:hypothetical protein